MSENTFLGLQPYTEADAYRFKGRKDEIQELFRLIVHNDYTVCYAESGEGKTSLLNAGVFPLLRRNMYFPINITFTNDDFKNTPNSFDEIIDRCVKDCIADYNNTHKPINVEYKLCSADFQNMDCQADLQQELSQYSWWSMRNYRPQAMGLIFTPVFVFDQFEEVFNLPDSAVWTKKFFDWLEEVSSDSCPAEIIKKIRARIGDLAAFPSIREEKNFNAVFSLRKEFIGELDYWAMQKCFIPSLKNNRYCLKALTYKGARNVMSQQVRFGENTIKQVLDYFVKKYSREPEQIIDENLPIIPALLLSVVCDSWEKDIDFFSWKEDNDIGQSLNIILERFYDKALSSISNELLQTEGDGNVESILENIETIIFALIDNNGKRVRRKSSELPYLDSNATYKEVLSDNRIIKILKINGEDYIEIIHDSLCPIIIKRKELALVTKTRELDKEKRRKANYKKFLSRQNPLSLSGRQIWDNKVFSFSLDNSRSTRLNNSSNTTEVLWDLLQRAGNDGGGVEQLFFDKFFKQAVKPGKISLDFNGSCSKDGISVFEIETEKVMTDTGKQLKIKRITFKDSRNEDFYTVNGFCGIVCGYDKETGSEIRREYICNGYTSAGIVIIKFENHNKYGFPTKVTYFDCKENPCKHIDGNYGVQIEYDDYGRESCRWYLDQYGGKISIYNGVSGLVNQYDELDRVIKQYFVDKDGNRIFDVYGFHGIKINYNDALNELLVSETIYIDENDSPCNGPQGFCIEQFQYDDKGKVVWQLYLDKDREIVEKKDGVYFYSKLKIGYDESDRPNNLAMYNSSDTIFKIIRYYYSLNGNISGSSFYESKKSKNGQIERKAKSDDNSVHGIKYVHDNHGVLACIEYFDEDGNPTTDINNYSKINILYDNQGILTKRCFYNFKKLENRPIYEVQYKYMDDGTSEITYIEYKTDIEAKTTEKLLGIINKKKGEESISVEETISTYKGILNHRCELVKVYLDENNGYINGIPLTVRRKYDIDNNVIEELLYDKNDIFPICDKNGDYGWRVDYNVKTRERKIESLNRNLRVANNNHNYAIVQYSHEKHEGSEYSVTSYFDEDYKPALCEYGYHKKLEKVHQSYNDVFCNQVLFENCVGEERDSVDGYSRQIFEEERINGNEIRLTVSFWGADGTPRINKACGFHKRVKVVSTENESMERSLSYKDENDCLINIGGFAKKTCKRYNSFWTFFYFPFRDFKKIRFYDENDQKVDTDFWINGKTYHAYKFIVPLDSSSFYQVTNSAGKTVYRNYSLFWGYFNFIWIPPTMLFLFVGISLYAVFKWLYNQFRPKRAAIPETASIIRVVQIFDEVQNGNEYIRAPIRQFDVNEGSWIVKWNNWSYDINQDNVTAFETAFNNSLDRKVITFYNPEEKEFLDVDIDSSSIGIRIQDAQVPVKDVEEMLQRRNMYSRG